MKSTENTPKPEQSGVFPDVCTAEQFGPGIAERFLRELCRTNDTTAINPATGETWIPKPKLGKYKVRETLAGLFAYYQHRSKAAHNRLDSVSFDTMEQMEGATGISKSLQQLAKSKGCLAFRGPRVYLLDLLRWIFKEAAGGTTADWGELNTELDAKLKQVKLDVELRELITRDEAEQFAGELSAVFFGWLNRFTAECPRDFEQRSKDYIKKAVAEKKKQVTAGLTAQLEKLKHHAETIGETK